VRREAVPMNVLIVDDEQTVRETCAAVAAQSGMKAIAVATAEEAFEVLEHSAVDILLTDLKLPRTNGVELLKLVHDLHPEVAVVVLTQYDSIESAVQVTRLGAMDYVTKPFRIEELRSRLERVARAVELQQENRLLREQLQNRPGFGGLIGLSMNMQRVYKMIEKVSQHEYPVLILGESGTGKELVARCVHYSGPRKDRPFAPVDCSSLVPTLIESELFGSVKGAFTGPCSQSRDSWRPRTGARYFSTRLATCRWTCRPSSFAPFRSARSNPLVPRNAGRSTCVLSPPRTATSSKTPTGNSKLERERLCGAAFSFFCCLRACVPSAFLTTLPGLIPFLLPLNFQLLTFPLFAPRFVAEGGGLIGGEAGSFAYALKNESTRRLNSSG
jgi:DNA-binding response OmpR family regulator